MEDISRELEKEIESYSNPVRIKRKSGTRLIVVDDFGKMKSADWIKKFVLFLFILSLVLLATTILFYNLYSNYKAESLSLREGLNIAEKKTKDLVNEKEYLMAKLVISEDTLTESKSKIDQEGGVKTDVKKTIESKVAKIAKKRPKSVPKRALAAIPQKFSKPVAPELPEASSTELIAPAAESQPDNVKKVGIERFVIVKDELSKDLLVGFRVLNVTSELGDISGRVFVVLSYEEGSGINQWVVPTVPLENNIPTVPRRGQYFSIAHFKPVKFRIRNIPNPELYTKAVVLVFGKENTLILNEEINISINK